MLAHGRKVTVRGLDEGDEYNYDETRQTLTVRTKDNVPGKVHRIVVGLDPPLEQEFTVNSFWTDFGTWIFTLLVVLYFIFTR